MYSTGANRLQFLVVRAAVEQQLGVKQIWEWSPRNMSSKKTPCVTAFVQLTFVLSSYPRHLKGSRIAHAIHHNNPCTVRIFESINFVPFHGSLSLTKDIISAVSSAPANRKSASAILAGASILRSCGVRTSDGAPCIDTRGTVRRLSKSTPTPSVVLGRPWQLVLSGAAQRRTYDRRKPCLVECLRFRPCSGSPPDR